jgi:hypothetical protein
MAARIGLSTGKEWVVEGSVTAVAHSIRDGDPYTKVESEGRHLYIFRAHVAYVEEQPPSYEKRSGQRQGRRQ